MGNYQVLIAMASKADAAERRASERRLPMVEMASGGEVLRNLVVAKDFMQSIMNTSFELDGIQYMGTSTMRWYEREALEQRLAQEGVGIVRLIERRTHA